ncbi:MAG: endonuclease/exonuclease/phosphatase family protein [Bacteroidota bacterium]|nr:endonuclease/exonuclease/phosphatase family protein [Bacteroidota bacterium]MDX5426840.1 endonuclease/exonuclease/phosphatase family protein [Bacteroidota bacterium]MDX5504826.1 endonuclease/exonuclease/phosphatase family protein [Bacteroidota bacterium]
MFRKLSLFQKILYILNVPTALALLIADGAYYINSSTVLGSWLAIFSIGWPVLAILNILFVLLWSIFLKRTLLLSLFVLILGIPQFKASYSFSSRQKHFIPGESIKVMSYNVRGYDRYRWLYKNLQKEKFTDFFRNNRPNILCVQEHMKHYTSPNIHLKYVHEESKYRPMTFGLATYSDYPIIQKGKVDFTDQTGPYGFFIFTDVLFKNDTIRIYNAHLMSNYLNPNEYEALKELDTDRSEEIERDIRDILKRLRKGAMVRGSQIEDIVAHMETWNGPMLLCADLNSTPTTFPYRSLAGRWNDAFVESGKGFGNTYSRIPVPLRIDHIFVNDRLEAYNYRILGFDYSDHFPVTVELELLSK